MNSALVQGPQQSKVMYQTKLMQQEVTFESDSEF